jgi:hypothetical protein
MTQYPDLFAALAAPFEQHEVKLRQAAGGRQVPYITARTAMNRLDSALGPENWWDEYVPLENSVICKLSIRLPDGSVVTKSDAGGYAGMSDSGDDDKSGFSDAFKRTAAKFGVARYLYRDGVPDFVRERVPALDQTDTARPTRNGARATGPSPPRERSSRSNDPVGKVPGTGKALFAWAKDQDEHHKLGLLKHLNDWAKRQGFPARMIDWNLEQVASACEEASRKIQATQPARTDVYEKSLAN